MRTDKSLIPARVIGCGLRGASLDRGGYKNEIRLYECLIYQVPPGGSAHLRDQVAQTPFRWVMRLLRSSFGKRRRGAKMEIPSIL